MSQVVSIVVESGFEEACKAFNTAADIPGPNEEGFVDCEDFIVSYDESAGEIVAQGHLSDEVVSAFFMIRDQYGGRLFYEGEAWDGQDGQVVEAASRREKMWIMLGILFFPLTLVYLLLRLVVWVPYKLWKFTR